MCVLIETAHYLLYVQSAATLPVTEPLENSMVDLQQSQSKRGKQHLSIIKIILTSRTSWRGLRGPQKDPDHTLGTTATGQCKDTTPHRQVFATLTHRIFFHLPLTAIPFPQPSPSKTPLQTPPKRHYTESTSSVPDFFKIRISKEPAPWHSG